MAQIDEAQVLKAVNALLKWKKLQSKNQSLLSEEEEETEAEVLEENFIYLMLTLKKIPPKELTTPHKISLPHPLFHPLESFSNICFIIDDRPKKPLNSNSNLYAETMQKNKPHLAKSNLYAEKMQKNKPHMSKSKLDVETVQKKIKAEGIPISKVLKFSKLKAKYKSFEAKRELYGSYELFLTDKRVVHLLPGLLGKQFYKKKRKVPVPVDLRGNSSWKEEIERACASSLLCLGTGTCSVLKVGRGGMESGEVMENVLAAIEGIVEFVPKKLGGVRAVHLKFSDSLALPVYEDLPDSKIEDLKEPKATRKN